MNAVRCQSTAFHINQWKQGFYAYNCKAKNIDVDILFANGSHSQINDDKRVYDVTGNVAYNVNSSSRIVKELKSASGIFCIDLSNFLRSNPDVLAYKDCKDKDCKDKDCKDKQCPINQQEINSNQKERILSFVKTVIIPPPNCEDDL